MPIVDERMVRELHQTVEFGHLGVFNLKNFLKIQFSFCKLINNFEVIAISMILEGHPPIEKLKCRDMVDIKLLMDAKVVPNADSPDSDISSQFFVVISKDDQLVVKVATFLAVFASEENKRRCLAVYEVVYGLGSEDFDVSLAFMHFLFGYERLRDVLDCEGDYQEE